MIKKHIEIGEYNPTKGKYEVDAQIKAYLEAARRGIEENEGLAGLSAITNENGTIDWDEAKKVKKSAETENIKLKAGNDYEDALNEKEIRQKSAARNWTNRHN